MTPTRSGIPTTYAGTNFRSRLEARWAAFFDLVGWSWVYEPFDADGWIPDFLIEGNRPFLVEVGPCVSVEDFRAKSEKPAAYPSLPTLILGVAPRVLRDSELGERMGYCGLIANEWPGVVGYAFWTVSKDHRRLCVYQDESYHYPTGEGWTDLWHLDFTGMDWVDALWKRAGNDVQWKPSPERVGTILGRL